MFLDLPTLMFVGGLLGIVCGAVLLFVWWEHRDGAAALWWGAGHITLGVAVMLFAAALVAGWGWAFPIALTLIIAAPALIWSGVRSFWGKPVSVAVLVGSAIAWAGVAVALGPRGSALLPVINTLFVAGFGIAGAWELARGGSEPLRARAPLVVLAIANFAAHMLAIPDVLAGRLGGDSPPPLASLFGIVHFETIIYIVATTIFFVALIKERGELRRRGEAETDVLTQLPNRRAFFSSAERIVERHHRDGHTFAVAAFDLDHFKHVNDAYGHGVGDRALQTFAQVARESLRSGDLISRIGGEEFAAIFPGADLNTGIIMAERIRRAFAQAALVIDGREIGATVSGGVAVAARDEALTDLLERADAALYKAKLNGRDCVECDGDTPTYPHLVQVA